MVHIVGAKRTEMRSRYYTRSEAQRIGWNTDHPSRGGAFLEENEVIDFFPEFRDTLGLNRPDFAILGEDKKPAVVVECKSDAKDIDKALREAQEYAEAMSASGQFDIRLATGLAGTPDKRVFTKTLFRVNGHWEPLSAHGFPLTQLPTPTETIQALIRKDGTTDVQLPDEREFFDAAIQISNLLRKAKIEEAKRPLIVGTIITALWQGDFSLSPETVVEQINANVGAAIDRFKSVPDDRRKLLSKTLILGPESEGLRPHMERVVNQLERLNVRSIMRSGVDFLGQFYETFLRYGSDAKKLGVVFTPRHITRFCADLLEVDVGDKVYDPACGTGGFLVASFDRMMGNATTDKAKELVKQSIYGNDTSPTVWALAMLNMFFRGDGKSHIDFKSAFDGPPPIGKFDKVLLNPPFSQEGEPEIDFIDHALNSLKPGGLAAIVVKTNIVVDSDLSFWRSEIVKNHQVLGVFSLPVDLFYPTAAPSVIILIKAHLPKKTTKVMLSIIRNDGFTVSKKRRIACEGSELDKVGSIFKSHLHGQNAKTEAGFTGFVDNKKLLDGDEICAERWLESEPFTLENYKYQRSEIFRQMALAVANYTDAADILIPRFNLQLSEFDVGDQDSKTLIDWLHITNGKSGLGVSKYQGGEVPYISSADPNNSIVGMVQPPEDEIYDTPCVTMTAFGQAAVQPWKFCARGNGGSAVRVLKPAQKMTLAQMLWVTGQLNSQRWRFHYGRMATKGRLETLKITPPLKNLDDAGDLQQKLKRFRIGFTHLLNQKDDSDIFYQLFDKWKKETELLSSASQAALNPNYMRIIGLGERAIPFLLRELSLNPEHWFAALAAITGENPVEKKNRGFLNLMRDDWILWGKTNGYI